MTTVWMILNDEVTTRGIACDRLEAQVMGVCSDCGKRVEPDEADASQRCEECRP